MLNILFGFLLTLLTFFSFVTGPFNIGEWTFVPGPGGIAIITADGDEMADGMEEPAP